jgi:thiamine transport system substrate-binding protein
MLKKMTLFAITSLLFPKLFAFSPPPILEVLTYDSFVSEWGPGLELKKNFEAQCKCVVHFVKAADNAGILNRLELEKKKSFIDVVVGLDQTQTSAAAQLDLFVNLPKPKTESALQPLDFHHPDLFYPVDYGFFTLMYDSRKVKKMPESWEKLLLDPQFKKSLTFQDPRFSSPGFGLLLFFVQNYPKDYKEKWKNLKTITQNVTKGWSESYAQFTKGESTFVQSYTTSAVYHELEEKNTFFKAWYPKEGNVIQIELAGILKSSKKQPLAQEFLNFLLSNSSQKIIAQKNWMYPVTQIKDLPPAFYAQPKPEKVITIDSKQVLQEKSKWTKEWLEVF